MYVERFYENAIETEVVYRHISGLSTHNSLVPSPHIHVQLIIIQSKKEYTPYFECTSPAVTVLIFCRYLEWLEELS